MDIPAHRLIGLRLTRELLATAVARHVDGYSIYSARLPATD